MASGGRSTSAVRVAAMNWMAVEAWLARDDRAVLPIGSTEQHGHLSLAVDATLAERVAAEAAEPLGVPVFPVMLSACSPPSAPRERASRGRKFSSIVSCDVLSDGEIGEPLGLRIKSRAEGERVRRLSRREAPSETTDTTPAAQPSRQRSPWDSSPRDRMRRVREDARANALSDFPRCGHRFEPPQMRNQACDCTAITRPRAVQDAVTLNKIRCPKVSMQQPAGIAMPPPRRMPQG
jgi:hypothetical protein